jgi:sensor histidine kinase YesM
MSKRHKIIFHTVFWLISISLSFYAWGLPHYQEGNLYEFVLNLIATHSSTIVYFYVNYFILVPYLLAKKKYALFALFSVLHGLVHVCMCVYLWCNYQFDFSAYTFAQYGPMTYECIFYGVISTVLRMFENWFASEELKQRLEKELTETELLFLQSQMSPHFIFNTLNSIYSLSLKKSSVTATAISQLKDLIEYLKYFETREKIELVKEIDFLESYISLQKLRNNVELVFEKNLVDPIHKFKIEPMLLLPFIENAFKHGDMKKNILVKIYFDQSTVQFSVENKINAQKRKDSVGGIGIQNIERRLALLYPNRHRLFTAVDDTSFSLLLTINLK